MSTSSESDDERGVATLESIVLRLEEHNLIWPAVLLSVLLALIGANAQVHGKLGEGAVYFVLLLSILWTGDKPAQTFFGSSSLALFIILHITLFGANALALIISFVIYVVFRKFLLESVLFPITVYLFIDTVVIYYDVVGNMMQMARSAGRWMFTGDSFYALFSIVPSIYGYILIERLFASRFPDSHWKRNGPPLSLGLFAACTLPISIWLRWDLLGLLAGISTLLYMVGELMNFDRGGHRKAWIARIPLVILFVEALVINAS